MKTKLILLILLVAAVAYTANPWLFFYPVLTLWDWLDAGGEQRRVTAFYALVLPPTIGAMVWRRKRNANSEDA